MASLTYPRLDTTPTRVSHSNCAATIERLAESRLRSSQYPAVRSLICEFHDGVLTLRGRVHSYYLKQIAQAAVDGLDGVLEVANRIDVVRTSINRTVRPDGRGIFVDESISRERGPDWFWRS